MTSAKSLTKTAVLDASDDPKDQDKARERRVKMDFASWRKQTKSGKKTHQEEVGISSAVAMKKAREEAKRKLIQDKAVAKQKAAFGDSDKQVKEAKVDAGKSADEKATARNQRNNPKKGDKGFRKFATSAFIRRKEGQSLAWGKDSAASELRRKAHAARRGVKEETIDEKFATQYKDKGKLSKTDAPGSRHDHTHDVDPRMADHVPTKKVRKSSKAETRANVLKFDMKKEEVQLERALDTFEKNKKEDIVKGMKKSSKDLKKRYGSKWKNVMYATATKKAKEAGDTSKSDERYASESKWVEESDQAFKNVVAALQKKHGKDAVITKDNPPKPPTEAQKKAYAAHKAKIAKQDTRDDLEKSSQGRYSRKYSNAGSD